MTQEAAMQQIRNLGWRVTFAGLGINLALGVLYAWSVVKKEIPQAWGWSDFDKTLPYSLACLVFAITMVPAGRAQDRLGPRWVAMAGGIAVGLGMILAGLWPTVVGFVVGFGILGGMGLGMGYAAATPAAVKWFGPHRTGLIAGLVVAGFGLASVYIAPLAKFLIVTFSTTNEAGQVNTGPGVQATMMILGIAFLLIVGGLSQLLQVPPPGWKPPGAPAKRPGVVSDGDMNWSEMMQTPQFYLLWVMFAFAAGAGLMIIASLAKIVSLQGGIQAGFLFVALLAVGNAGGRVLSGMLSDRIGRKATLAIVFLLQAACMFVLSRAESMAAFAVLSMLLGANYGANLALFPAVTKEYFGIKNFGVNYGLVFTSWGVGGLVFSQVSGMIYDASRAANKAALMAGGMAEEAAAAAAVGSYATAYWIAGGCLLFATALLAVLRHPKHTTQAIPLVTSTA